MRRGGFALLMLFMVIVLAVLLRASPARADQPGAHTVQVAVLAFDSDDSEEQADAITGAIRSRIRKAQGWSLMETTQSLGMLTAALKCPTRPPPECQQKIGEQIKAERYIFGFVTKGPSQAQVTAEIHLFQKGKPDTVLKESYADNLKDPNDDTLQKIAGRIVERLGGAAVGVVIVKTPDLSGDVVVDGEKHVPLEKGAARIELAAGGHAIEVASATGAPIKRNVLVTAGRETIVELGAPATEPPAEGSKLNTRKLIGGISMGAGAVLAGIAVYELIHYLNLQSDGEERATHVDKTNPPTPCKERDPECQRIDNSSKTASGLAYGLGGAAVVALGFGAYMYFTAPSSDDKATTASAPPPKPKTRVVPAIGAGSGGVVVVGTF